MTPNAIYHAIDACTCSAGLRRRKRTSWRGPILALLAVGVLVLRSVL
jgi:hypothetical protein